MTASSQVKVRKGTRQDVPAVLDLIRELATYERQPDAVTLTMEELENDGFGPDPIYRLFVAESATGILGIALYYEKYSTWQGRCIFLEDIIVTASERGKGIGKRLFDKVIEVAGTVNAARLEWQVLDWNMPAIGFYRKYGAELDGEWLNGKLTREQLQRI